MSNSDLNQKLVESFGELEKMCNFIYDDLHGVTCYINELDSLELSQEELSILKSLKSVRRKRNKLSHGDALFEDSCATEEDIKFLEGFMKSVSAELDPLELYSRKKRRSPKKAVPAPETESSSSNDVGAGIFIVLAVIVLICIFFAKLGQ